MDDACELIDNEWYIVRYSGETPEIAYNSAIYFLTRAGDGPQVTLGTSDVERLRQAAVDRYEEIVLRDMYHENVGTSVYRGIARSICNYQRFVTFCKRQTLSAELVRSKAGKLFVTFLEVELQRLAGNGSATVINCSFVELKGFAVSLGIPFPSDYTCFERYCLP
ncbi:MAG: hypothetical protein COA36_08500 [Desulfotalea sp.]|nr:MAG: hypothetical protein COA36_08500 [Desulfotalea sp.]